MNMKAIPPLVGAVHRTARVVWFVTSTVLLSNLAIALNTSPDESAAITKTALDYIEGWYAGDDARMEHALHPELAKWMISIDPKTGTANSITWGRWRLSNVRATAAERRRRQISN